MIKAKRGRLDGLHKCPGGTAIFDSHLERDYMRQLEATRGVKTWTKDHGIKIAYSFVGIPKTYLPDFLVTYQDGSQELHETKGAGFLYYLTTHAKRTAADTWCRERGMKYVFIENSQGMTFAANNALQTMAKPKDYSNLDDLLKR